jgi:hypothetical protein
MVLPSEWPDDAAVIVTGDYLDWEAIHLGDRPTDESSHDCRG